MFEANEILFENKSGKIFQSSSYSVYIQTKDHSFHLCIKEFIKLRSKINHIDIKKAIDDLSDFFDYTEVVLKQKKAPTGVQKYTLCQLIVIKELFNGAYFAMELQDLLYRKGIAMSQHEYALSNLQLTV
ncbi:MAG: hypothetical protein EAZ07_03945 [Cytophagales bacterium]|nr:MAG: hypothetical protein EAZ07_03945 [Cytophagales bacterium]